MKIKTSDLTGAALDWVVAKCEGVPLDYGLTDDERYSTDWAQGGPIIEREKIGVWWDGQWHAKYDGCKPNQVQDAYDPLIAAMRCYVASKMGDEVEVPDELSA